MNGLSLFTGFGIGELAFKNIIPDYRTVGYVEWDKYCQDGLRARINDGILDDAPIFGDIREFNERYAHLYTGKVDFISGGFPCQPFSVAGKNLGAEDERNMWPATLECISIIRPQFCLLENVPNLLTHEYIRRIFGDLAEIGYDCEWDVVSAAFVGAPHLRKRVWILAESRHLRCDTGRPEQSLSRAGTHGKDGDVADANQRSGRSGNKSKPIKEKQLQSRPNSRIEREDVADTESRRRKRRGSVKMGRCGKMAGGTSRGGWWSVEPDVGRVAHGVAHRVDRLKALGNGWVPQVVKRILQVTPKES